MDRRLSPGLLHELTQGMAKVHVLHRAACEPIYGAAVGAELGQPLGRLYSLLHGLEAAKFLERDVRVVGGRVRKYYRITPLGLHVLDQVRRTMSSLVDDVDG